MKRRAGVGAPTGLSASRDFARSKINVSAVLRAEVCDETRPCSLRDIGRRMEKDFFADEPANELKKFDWVRWMLGRS